MRVDGIARYALLGETQDDAAGEAFDKTATLLGLGYPGGPALARLAESGIPGRHRLPRPMIASGDLEFSFSGLKTAVMLLVRGADPEPQFRADVARAFQDAIVEVLASKCAQAMEATGLTSLVVAGGVGANRALRARLDAQGARSGFDVFYPEPELCTDNGAMIALAAALRLQRQDRQVRKRAAFGVRPRWDLASLT
jgi:N6-L-threonylcarbamoyladenine synthase